MVSDPIIEPTYSKRGFMGGIHMDSSEIKKCMGYNYIVEITYVL